MAIQTDPVQLKHTALPTRRFLRVFIGSKSLLASGILVAFVLLMAVLPQLFTGFGPGPTEACDLNVRNAGPSADHWFGVDPQGCDYYTNVIFGARTSVTIGLTVTVASFLIAVVFGAIAGYFGGIIDALISRVVDIFFGLPFILAAIVILQLFEARNVWTVAFALAAFSWPGGVRYMRASVLSVRERDFVTASRTLGARSSHILRKHVVPNSLTPLLVLQTLGVGTAIAAEAGLTFIGVGLTPPAISWGLQLATAKEFLTLAPHLLVFPAVFLTITVLAFVVFGEALRDKLDPKD